MQGSDLFYAGVVSQRVERRDAKGVNWFGKRAPMNPQISAEEPRCKIGQIMHVDALSPCAKGMGFPCAAFHLDRGLVFIVQADSNPPRHKTWAGRMGH